MLLALHRQAEDDQTALCALQSTDNKITDKHLRLHKPVEDLKNAVLTDHEINMFFHKMFWQQYQLPNSSEGTKIPSWQLMVIMTTYI